MHPPAEAERSWTNGQGDEGMAPDSARFPQSWLLGDRAPNVYSWFLKSLHLPGDVAECGVFTGETSRELVKHLEEERIP